MFRFCYQCYIKVKQHQTSYYQFVDNQRFNIISKTVVFSLNNSLTFRSVKSYNFKSSND